MYHESKLAQLHEEYPVNVRFTKQHKQKYFYGLDG